jgi:hypothetical protein
MIMRLLHSTPLVPTMQPKSHAVTHQDPIRFETASDTGREAGSGPALARKLDCSRRLWAVGCSLAAVPSDPCARVVREGYGLRGAGAPEQ